MRSRTAHCSDESSFIQRSSIKFELELPLTAKILISQGVIDDITLAFSDDGLFSGEIFADNHSIEQSKNVIEWLQAYGQKKPQLNSRLKFNLANLTPFSKRALNAISQISFGSTCTYGGIAKMIGSSGSSRAIGSACHHNPFPLLIPCHRIVAKHGMGGFAYPLAIKQFLLDFEKTR